MKKLIRSTLVGAALFAAPFSQAAMVTDWSYAVTLEWVSQVFGAGGGSQVTTTNLLTWGDPAGNHTVAGGGRSGLGITESPANGTVETNGAAAETNIITHYNNPISASFATLTSAVLNSTLLLTPLNPAGATLDIISTNFNITFIETPNTSPCPFPSVSVCDDIFIISSEALNSSFDYDGFTYFVSIIETSGSLNPLDANSCAQANIIGPCLGFQTPESLFTEAQFAFFITTEPVTIVAAPGVIGLFGIGLLTLAGIRRRQQNNKF